MTDSMTFGHSPNNTPSRDLLDWQQHLRDRERQLWLGLLLTILSMTAASHALAFNGASWSDAVALVLFGVLGLSIPFPGNRPLRLPVRRRG